MFYMINNVNEILNNHWKYEIASKNHDADLVFCSKEPIITIIIITNINKIQTRLDFPKWIENRSIFRARRDLVPLQYSIANINLAEE